MNRRTTAALVAGGLLLCACGGKEAPAARGEELIVFAAASTTDVVGELAREFAAAQVSTSFGPSSGLARQIEDGAPADVYLSASRRWVEYLHEAGALAEEPRVFAGNRLVAIGAPRAGTTAGAENVGELLARLAPGDLVAIADAGVPAGEYARQSLTATGDLEALTPYLVGQPDVRSVLRAVAAGEAKAGFVYTTDARVAEVEVLFAFDPTTHEAIEYFAAIPRTTRSLEQSRAFLDHLRSPRARALLESAGFTPAE